MSAIDYNEQLPFFVYGTLRPGFHNDHCWRGRATAHHDGEAFLPDYRIVGQGIPFAVPAEGEMTVGAIIVPDPEHWADVCARLDALEGFHPSSTRHYGYRRVKVTVLVGDDEDELVCWLYETPEHAFGGEPSIPGNDFANIARARS